MIRNHVEWSCELCERLRAAPDFEITSEPMLSLWSFRYLGPPASSRQDAGGPDLDALNLKLVEAINRDGRIYLTQTRLDGRVVIRFHAGQFECTREDVMSAYDAITQVAAQL